MYDEGSTGTMGRQGKCLSFCDHSQCIGLMFISIDSGHLRDLSVDGNIILTLMLTERYMSMWTGRQ